MDTYVRLKPSLYTTLTDILVKGKLLHKIENTFKSENPFSYSL